jgi:hypothetical protein
LSRSSSSLSDLPTSQPDSPRDCAKEDADEPFQDVELATSLDSIDAEGVEAWGKLDGIRIVGLDEGMAHFPISTNHRHNGILTISKLATRPRSKLGNPSTSG